MQAQVGKARTSVGSSHKNIQMVIESRFNRTKDQRKKCSKEGNDGCE